MQIARVPWRENIFAALIHSSSCSNLRRKRDLWYGL